MLATYITSFSQDHLSIYGNRFINSYTNFCENPCTIYSEGFIKPNTQTINYLDYYTAIPEHVKLKNEIETRISNCTNKKQIARLKKALR